MTDRVSVRCEVSSLQRQLREMVKAMNAKELTSVVYAAAKPIEDQAKANLEPHRRTGMLAKYVARSKGKLRPGMGQVAMGIKKGSETRTIPIPSGIRGILRRFAGSDVRRITPAKYARLVEDDFQHVLTGRTIQGSKFMSRAIRTRLDEVKQRIVDGVLRIQRRAIR